MTATQLESPCSIASDGSTNWNGIPRVRRKWVDAVEGMKFFLELQYITGGNILNFKMVANLIAMLFFSAFVDGIHYTLYIWYG